MIYLYVVEDDKIIVILFDLILMYTNSEPFSTLCIQAICIFVTACKDFEERMSRKIESALWPTFDLNGIFLHLFDENYYTLLGKRGIHEFAEFAKSHTQLLRVFSFSYSWKFPPGRFYWKRV